jgi:Domain of unknown function (DUF4189)
VPQFEIPPNLAGRARAASHDRLGEKQEKSMQRAYLIFAIVFSTTIVGINPGGAELVLAIGYAEGGPTHGWVYGQSSGGDAATVALNVCRGIDMTNNVIPANPSEAQKNCAIVATLNNHCFAISSNGTLAKSPTGFSWVVAPDLKTANGQALANCEKMKGKGDASCTIRGARCDSSASNQE